ncbi:hypothetical protein RB597_000540 [Gaeumannomyces tritici]
MPVLPPPQTIRLGTASPATQATTAETLALLERVAFRAAGLGVDILLLPEAFIGGYPRGSTFGCAIGGRSADGREEFRRYFRAAVDLGDTVGPAGAGAGSAWVRRELEPDRDDSSSSSGPCDGNAPPGVNRGDGTRERLEEIARRTGVFIVIGCIERAGGSLYCAAVYVCPKLGMIGKRRKVMPLLTTQTQTGSERLVWAQGSPATLRAVSTTIRGVRINMAAAICWESYMPLLRQALYAQNINLYLAPTADGRDAWLSLMRTVGAEGRCFVVSSNMCVRQPTSSIGGGGAEQQQQQQQQQRQGSVYDSPSGVPTNEPAGSDGGTSWMSAGPVVLGDEYDADAADPPPMANRQRRTSIITEDGHEIVLPSLDKSRNVSPKATARSANGRRRRSVFDEYGNEIVLCSKVADGDVENGMAESNGPSRDARGKSHPGATASVTTAQSRKTAEPSGGQFISRGGSCITGPYGDVLAAPLWEDDSTINIADVDFEDCVRGRLDLDAAGSYSRNDSFKFSVEGLDLSPLPYY